MPSPVRNAGRLWAAGLCRDSLPLHWIPDCIIAVRSPRVRFIYGACALVQTLYVLAGMPQCPHSFLLQTEVPPLSPAAAATAFLDQLRASFLSRMERVKGELTTMVDDAGGSCAREGWEQGHAADDV